MTTTKGTTSQMASNRPGAVIHDFGIRKTNPTVNPVNKVLPGPAMAGPKAATPAQGIAKPGVHPPGR